MENSGVRLRQLRVRFTEMSSAGETSAGFLVAVVLIGAGLGWAVASQPNLVALGAAALVAAAMAMICVRQPQITVILFWVLYVLQTTALGELLSGQGLYYPLYALMAGNTVLYLVRRRGSFLISRWVMFLYVSFVGVILLGLVWQPAIGISVDVDQRLFIYVLGLLSALQIRSDQARLHVFGTMVAAAVFVSGWTILEASGSGFAYRAGLDINQNWVASLLGFGLVPLFAYLLSPSDRRDRTARILSWFVFLVGLYALLLLASRSVSICLAGTLGSLWVRRVSAQPRRFIGITILLVIIFVSVMALPGSSGLADRFQNEAGDGFNGRLPLWQAAIEHVMDAPIGYMLLGGGMGQGERIVSSVADLTAMHNVYLQYLVDYGVVGLLIFVALMAIILRQNSRVKGALGDSQLGMVTFLTMLCIASTIANNHIFWVAFGVALPTFSESNLGSKTIGEGGRVCT